jgi:hypothetical protein
VNNIVELMLSTGAMTGPHRKTHPITLTPWIRLKRALRRALSASFRDFNPKGFK